ncbi:enamelin [Tiliqua scincoides]|uniref:enamelin n=1 Tax=Tiliqua scincoides TaxID=71010 RepID=UPI003461D08F
MKIIFLCLGLVGISCAMLVRRPRRAGFGSKSEEMAQFGPYGYMNSPQLAQLAAALFGYRSSLPQPYAQQPISPLQGFYLWQQQTPAHQAARFPQHKPRQTPVARQPNSQPQPRPQFPQQPQRPQQPQPRVQQPPKIQLQNGNPANPSQTHQQVPVLHPKGGKQQQPQAFPPNQQHPWHFPQIFGQGGFHQQPFGPYQGRLPLGFGRPQPPNSEEGSPYFGYGYQGMGGRPPYYSEEMYEQDFETPKEKEATKEPPAADPATNATVPETNSTVPNLSGQGGNATIPGLSAIGSGANSPPLESNLLGGNGVPTPFPTAHVSGSDGAAQNGINQSSQRANFPNADVIQSFQSGNQQSTGYGSYFPKTHPGMHDIRHNTLVSRGNPSGQTENPMYPLGNGENSNYRGNHQITNSNHPLINTRTNLYGQQEQPYHPERNPSGQRERVLFPSSDPQNQRNKDPVQRDNGLNNSPPEGRSMNPQFNKLGQIENIYNGREETDWLQPSGKHQSNSLSHQTQFSATRRTPMETETHPYNWKEQVFHPSDHGREQFPHPQNHMWNNQENTRVFQEELPRYNSKYPSNSFDPKGHIAYSENNSYGQRTRPFLPGAWEDKENTPTVGPVSQRERPSYPPMLPSVQMQRNSYPRSDSFVQQGHEPYPRQSQWSRDKHLLEQDREYRNYPYNEPQHHAYPKYFTENPVKQRDTLPYEDINRWTPEEHSPVYGAEERMGKIENIPYRMNNKAGHRERNLQNQGSNSPQQSSTFPQERSQYSETDTWRPQMVGPPTQKEISPYFNTYSTEFRRNPTHTENTGGTMQRSAHFSRASVAERRHYPNTLQYPEDYPREHRTVTYPTASDLCCAGDSQVPRENLLAPLRSAPQFRLASWEQRGSSSYPDSIHSKHVRHALYPPGIPSSHRSTSLQTGTNPSNQGENLGSFGEKSGPEKSPPCSESQVGPQIGHDTNHETGLLPTRDSPCYGNCIRGDTHNILTQNTGASPFNGELESAPSVQHVPENIPPPEGMKTAALGSEDERKEQYAAFGFKRIPCFGSHLNHYLFGTGAPSGDKQHDQFYAENPIPSEKPAIVPPEPQPISSTSPSLNVEEKPWQFNSLGEDLADQPNERTPDCLLLQNQ